jgi:hypothetical protein
MKLEKKKLKRFQSSLDVVTGEGGLSNRLKKKAEDLMSPTSTAEGAKFNIKEF